MATAAHHRFSFEEYVALVEDKGMKLEFLEGQVWAMSGGTVDHARATANLSTLLGTALRGRQCAVYSPDLRVRAQATGLATYADVTVICGQVELDPADPRRSTALNPRLIIEVLSPSTEAYDRGDKLVHYQTIASLEEILLVAHDRREVEVVRREPDGSWSRQIVADGGTVRLSSLEGCEIPVAEIYRDPLAPR